MLLLVSGATGYARTDTVGHFIVPKQWNDPAKLGLVPGRWAQDNGCFVGFDAGAFMRMLEKFAPYPGCLFTAAPDFVGDAASTLDRWPFWSKVLRGIGRSPAFVAQNGLTVGRVPWDEFDTLFIGGDDAYKDGPQAREVVAYAKARGKWVHAGRVNGKRRYAQMLAWGVDSIDGTGFSMFPDTNIQLADAWHESVKAQQEFRL